jgi:hypothetical protein
MKIQAVPTITVSDWQSLARQVLASGPCLIPATTDANAAHASLYKHGIAVYQVRRDGALVAYSVEPIRKRHKKAVT